MSVSVIIPAYNAQETIVRAIGSTLEQTSAPAEVIVIDDVSTDQTAVMVKALADSEPRIRLISNAVNSGPSKSRNLGIQAATGDWIAILDADDAWMPNRLEIMRKAAASHQADVVADNQLLYDAADQVVTRTGFPANRPTRLIEAIDAFEQEIKLGAEFSYGILKPMIRRAFLDESHLRYNEELRYGEDLLFLAEMLLSGARAVLIPDPLYIYTTRVGDKSGQPSPHSRSNPEFDRFADGVDALRSKYSAVVTLEIARAMRRMSRRFRLEHAANIARAARRERGTLAYLWQVAHRPSVLAEVVLRRASQWTRLLGH